MRSGRKQRIEKRKDKLGENFTSDWTWRKFSTRELAKLNPAKDFDTVDSIYEIGWCNGQDKFFDLLTKHILAGELHNIEQLNKTIMYGVDGLGDVPIGDYLKTFVWSMKDMKCLIQVIRGSFERHGEQLVFERDVSDVDIRMFPNRKLIYPVE